MKLLIVLILIIKTFCIYPVHKIILANKIKDINEYNDRITDIKGTGLIFDDNSEYNLLPYNYLLLFKQYYESEYLGCSPYIYNLDNGLSTLKCYFQDNDLRLDPINIVTKDFGIKIPLKHFFNDKKYFIFSSSEEQENIIIGKQLITLMGVKITKEQNNDIVEITNSDFIIDIE